MTLADATSAQKSAKAHRGTGEVLGPRDLLLWAHDAALALDAAQDRINALNVFPVPDADTGSNMAHTMRVALEAALRLPGASFMLDHEEQPGQADTAASAQQPSPTLVEIAGALATGAVRGARGNSGMVLSQVLRGFAQASGKSARGVLDAPGIAAALHDALACATEAIHAPQEGTVLTVLAAATQSIEADATSDGQGRSAAHAACTAHHAALEALAHTEHQLPVLQQAGVVDAGGAGLVTILECLCQRLAGNCGDTTSDASSPKPGGTHDADRSEADESNGILRTHHRAPTTAHAGGTPRQAGGDIWLELMWFSEGQDPDALRRELAPLGESLVIARAGEQACTVHLHTNRPAQVIERAYALATVSDLRIEALEGANDARETEPQPKRVVLALVPPGDLAAMFADAGAYAVVRDGDMFALGTPSPTGMRLGAFQTAQAITTELVAASHGSGAREVILLPNGLLQREELRSIEHITWLFRQRITIVPTATVLSGLAALSVHDVQQPLTMDVYAMSEASAGMRVAVLGASDAGASDGSPTSDTATPEASVACTEASGADAEQSPQGHTEHGDALTQRVASTIQRMLESGGEQVSVLHQPTADMSAAGLRRLLDAEDIELAVIAANGCPHAVEIGVE